MHFLLPHKYLYFRVISHKPTHYMSMQRGRLSRPGEGQDCRNPSTNKTTMDALCTVERYLFLIKHAVLTHLKSCRLYAKLIYLTCTALYLLANVFVHPRSEGRDGWLAGQHADIRYKSANVSTDDFSSNLLRFRQL